MSWPGVITPYLRWLDFTWTHKLLHLWLYIEYLPLTWLRMDIYIIYTYGYVLNIFRWLDFTWVCIWLHLWLYNECAYILWCNLWLSADWVNVFMSPYDLHTLGPMRTKDSLVDFWYVCLTHGMPPYEPRHCQFSNPRAAAGMHRSDRCTRHSLRWSDHVKGRWVAFKFPANPCRLIQGWGWPEWIRGRRRLQVSSPRCWRYMVYSSRLFSLFCSSATPVHSLRHLVLACALLGSSSCANAHSSAEAAEVRHSW